MSRPLSLTHDSATPFGYGPWAMAALVPPTLSAPRRRLCRKQRLPETWVQEAYETHYESAVVVADRAAVLLSRKFSVQL